MRRQTYGCLPSRKALPPIGWYQIILLGDRWHCTAQMWCSQAVSQSLGPATANERSITVYTGSDRGVTSSEEVDDRRHNTIPLSLIVTTEVSLTVLIVRDFLKPNAHPVTQPTVSNIAFTPLDSCCKAEPKIFVPLQTPFPGARDGQNLINWRRSLSYLQTQFGEDRWTQLLVNRAIHTPTDRTDYNTLRRS